MSGGAMADGHKDRPLQRSLLLNENLSRRLRFNCNRGAITVQSACDSISIAGLMFHYFT
jgi:hypothetical protein